MYQPAHRKKGPESQCEPHRDQIKQAYESGLSIERIHQDLKPAYGFTGSYHSIRRFVKALQVDEPERVHRMECEPGQEAQIDYGTLYLPIGENRRLKKVPVFLVTLSHSSKGYVEAVLKSKHRELSAKPGKCIPSLRRGAAASVPGQPQGRCDQGGLV